MHHSCQMLSWWMKWELKLKPLKDIPPPPPMQSYPWQSLAFLPVIPNGVHGGHQPPLANFGCPRVHLTTRTLGHHWPLKATRAAPPHTKSNMAATGSWDDCGQPPCSNESKSTFTTNILDKSLPVWPCYLFFIWLTVFSSSARIYDLQGRRWDAFDFRTSSSNNLVEWTLRHTVYCIVPKNAPV